MPLHFGDLRHNDRHKLAVLDHDDGLDIGCPDQLIEQSQVLPLQIEVFREI
jgi:hypothetical protein